MKNNIIKNITYATVGFIALYLIYSFYSSTFMDVNSKKLNNIEIVNSLKNIKNEADLYYADKFDYGNMPENIDNNSCDMVNSFFQNEVVKNIINKVGKENAKCILYGDQKILSWSFTVKDKQDFYCIDESGIHEKLNNYPLTVKCK